MITTEINISNSANTSLQIGDSAYVSEILAGNIISNPVYAGLITSIDGSSIQILGPSGVINTGISATVVPQFLSFAKDARINESSLKGYYADVTFKNNSSNYAELFAVSSDIAVSSK